MEALTNEPENPKMMSKKQRELHENYILIHEFEHPDELMKAWVRNDPTYTGHHHEYWECLMPVLKKAKYVANFLIPCLSMDYKHVHETYMKKINGGLTDIDIDKAYKGLVEFLKWYKTYKK